MAYCPKCGTKNDDDATFCKQCGAVMSGTRRDYEKDWENRCDDDCSGRKNARGWTIFWGVIIILIGLYIIFEIVLKNFAKDVTWLAWVQSVEFGWIFAAVIGLFIIILGLRIISRK